MAQRSQVTESIVRSGSGFANGPALSSEEKETGSYEGEPSSPKIMMFDLEADPWGG